MKADTLSVIREGAAAKGDVLATARIAGIMAVKKTWELIPLCHLVAACHITMDFNLLSESNEIEAVCKVGCTGRTGAEMEALTGVTIALLTIYDMCKAIDREMELHSIALWEKSGGKSGDFKREG
ncbi:molybdopterin cofactor synthesis protein a [Holotrichia oblita]|nr:molybdopterin cofactor synthesis protein a [Holotrichia oblita]